MNLGAHSRKWLRDSPGAQIGAGVVVLAYALAFMQRPGRVFTDTRIEFTIDPVRFLHAVASMWSPTGDLGHVQSGEFVGYLIPMAPWYAFAHTIGLPTWIAQRIWLGTLLALAGVGVVILLTALLPRRAPVAQAVAGLLYVANPYVVVVTGRTSDWLAAYAVLPWLLFAVHRGLRRPGTWRWPAVIGLLALLANGGVNAALPFWILIAALALLAYEVAVLHAAAWRAAGLFAVKSIVCAAVVSLWWVVPVLLTTRYAPNFLSFTEQPLTILATPSASESLRLLGYWVLYYGLGTGPATPSAGASAYLFEPLVIVATFVVPLVAFAGFAWTRRWSYAAFFVLLGVTTVMVMSLGFPPGSPLNRLLVPVYYDAGPLQVLRTTWKAAPLLALSLACLAGVAIQTVVGAARTHGGIVLRKVRVPAWTLAVLLPVPILWAWPLFHGTAIGSRLAYGSVPSYWRAALGDATRATTANQRVMVLPGELFGWYRWGETVDSALPFLTPRRLTIREIERHSDLRASQLQIAVDDLVQQNRLVPGQLTPLLRLLGVGSVLVPGDGDLARDGATDPADVANALRDQAPFVRSNKNYGRVRTYLPEAGRDGPSVRLAQVRRYAIPDAGSGVVRIHPFGDTTVLDGDGYGISELAADGLLDPRRAVLYAGDLRRGQLSAVVGSGARLVFSDSNRLRVVGPSTIAQDLGPTLAPGDPISPDTPYYALFPKLGASAETVATYSGLAYLRTPGPHRGGAIFPEDGPYAALDGSLDTAWLADGQAPESQRYLELKFRAPHDVSSIGLYPLTEQLGATTAVDISVNGASASNIALRPGWNRIPITTEPVRKLRITIADTVGATGGGIRELRIPGVNVRQALRLPTDLASETRVGLGHNALTILLARASADFPYREHSYAGTLEAASSLEARDAESGIRRIVSLPAARSFSMAGWASVRPDAPDALIDQLVAVTPRWTFSSSDRYEGVPINRASSAFDGDPQTAWVAHFDANEGVRPWVQVSWPHPLKVGALRLVRGGPQYDFPSEVRVTSPHAPAQEVPVGDDGTVLLRQTLRTNKLRLQVENVQPPIGKVEFLRFLDAVALAEIDVPGLRPPPIPRRGSFATACGALSVTAGAARLPAVVSGSIQALDQGEALRLRGCGPRPVLRLPARTSTVYAPPGRVMQPDHLAFDGPAPEPLPAPASEAVAAPGAAHPGSQDGIRPGAHEASWLVLGEGYSRGWQAWCRDRSGRERQLGPAQPIDGYANGWQIGPGCASARMAFVPQHAANLALVLSVLAIVAVLAIALGASHPVRRLRRLGHPTGATLPTAPQPMIEVPAGAYRYGLLTAAAWGLGLELFGALVFAPRFGAVVGPLTFVLVLIGIGVRRLVLLASVAVAAVPILYLVRPVSRDGGATFNFSLDQLAAHWLVAGAMIAIGGAAFLQAWRLRSLRRGESAREAAQFPRGRQAKDESTGSKPAEPAVRL